MLCWKMKETVCFTVPHVLRLWEFFIPNPPQRIPGLCGVVLLKPIARNLCKAWTRVAPVKSSNEHQLPSASEVNSENCITWSITNSSHLLAQKNHKLSFRPLSWAEPVTLKWRSLRSIPGFQLMCTCEKGSKVTETRRSHWNLKGSIGYRDQ